MYSKSTDDLPPFYVEYEHTPESLDKEVADYRIHISFPTTEEASALFVKMVELWQMPVSLKENRVVIEDWKASENKDRGVRSNFFPGNTVEVLFATELETKQFHEYLDKAKGLYEGNKLPQISHQLLLNESVIFWELTQPKFSLEHRISAYNQLVKDCNFKPSLLHHDFSVEANQKAIDQLVYLYWQFKFNSHLPELFPIELIILILQTANTLRFKDTSNSLYEISKRFQMPNEQLPVPYQKIDCHFKWTVAPTMYNQSGQLYAYTMYLHFICETSEDARIIVTNIIKARAGTDTIKPRVNLNIITLAERDKVLRPGKFPWNKGEYYHFDISGKPDCSNAGEIICSLINFKDRGVKCNKERVRFSVDSLLENKEFVALVLPPSEVVQTREKNPQGFFESNKSRERIIEEPSHQDEASSDWGCCGFDLLCAFVNWLISLLSSSCCCCEVEEEEGLRFN